MIDCQVELVSYYHICKLHFARTAWESLFYVRITQLETGKNTQLGQGDRRFYHKMCANWQQRRQIRHRVTDHEQKENFSQHDQLLEGILWVLLCCHEPDWKNLRNVTLLYSDAEKIAEKTEMRYYYCCRWVKKLLSQTIESECPKAFFVFCCVVL